MGKADLKAFLSSQGIELSEEELKHYGTKGMKWGESKTAKEIQDANAAAVKAAEKAGDAAMKKLTLKSTEQGLFDKTVKYKAPTKGEVNEKYLKGKKPTKDDVIFKGQTTRSAVKQGKINSFIEGVFRNAKKTVTGK